MKISCEPQPDASQSWLELYHASRLFQNTTNTVLNFLEILLPPKESSSCSIYIMYWHAYRVDAGIPYANTEGTVTAWMLYIHGYSLGESSRVVVSFLVSCPHPFRKNREGVCNSAVQRFALRGLYSARQSDCRVQLRHVNRFVTDLCTSWCCGV